VKARPGAIVAWWDGDGLAFGLVVAEEKDRARLVRSRGKDERVKPTRIAAIVRAGVPVPGAGPAERARAVSLVADVERRLRAEAEAVEVALLWEIVREGSDAPASGSFSIEEIAELALESASGEAVAVVTLALLADGLHFVRKGDGWTPREPTAVAALRTERERLARREAEKREFLSALPAAVESGTFAARGTEAERRYLEALERLAVDRDEAPETARNLALEGLEASGLRWTRPHEGAFRLLRRLGRFASDDENLQVLRFGLRTAFPADVLELARVRGAGGFDREGRRDLTGLASCSIDSPHTHEIDDLLSIEDRPGGGHRLGVHIADPAAFVAPDDPVDREALSRGVTHYMPDLRLPMLPPFLSEQASSLVVGEERPALSFLVDLDADGAIEAFDLTPSVVRCARRLSYEEADELIASGDEPLVGLAEVGRFRQSARARAGAVTIRAPEVDVHVDAEGRASLERIPAESPSRLAVSEAMVLAGAIAARFCIDAGLPAIYRRQSPPATPPELPADGVWDPVTVRRVRRGLRRAEVGLEPGPHAGLGLDAYVQPGSPLRRYQDLAIHRQVLSHLRGEPLCYDTDAMRRVAATTERAEADARRAEEAANEYWLLRYLERHVGEALAATVVETEPRPIVQLDETLREQPVRGLVGVEPGQRLRVSVVRVEPRAGVLSLRRVD
jgi:exoribonuclease-2